MRQVSCCRLYRPGYELVEIKSWELTHRVAWRPVSDLDAQVKALDALFPNHSLEAGSKAVAHRDALIFGAAEYERLAADTSSAVQRNQLVEKASKLRERAAD